MPCRYDDELLSSEHGIMSRHLQVKDMRLELDRVTQLLCCVCGMMQEPGLKPHPTNPSHITPCFQRRPVIELVHPELVSWFQKHHQADEDRIRPAMRDALRETASKRLQPVGEKDAVALAERFIVRAQAVHPVSKWHVNWFRFMARQAVSEYRGSDERRLKIAKQALKKLSPEERKALGLAGLAEGDMANDKVAASAFAVDQGFYYSGLFLGDKKGRKKMVKK